METIPKFPLEDFSPEYLYLLPSPCSDSLWVIVNSQCCYYINRDKFLIVYTLFLSFIFFQQGELTHLLFSARQTSIFTKSSYIPKIRSSCDFSILMEKPSFLII